MKILFFLIVFHFCHAANCTFIPPDGWEITQLKNPSPHVKIGFLGKGSKDFRPSINLALEEGVDVSLKDYVKAVKELQAQDPTAKLRDLGPFPISCGNGRLIEITNSSPWGEIRILQLLYVAKGTAYILTASVLKEDFSSFQNEILNSFRTLTLLEDLFSPIKDIQKRKSFSSFFSQLGINQEKDLEWKNLLAQVAQHKSLGAYWAYLVLQEGHEKIYSSTTSEEKN